MILSEPAAPTLVVERNDAALEQPLGNRPKVISILKERIGLAEIRDSNSPFPLPIYGLGDHDERIGGEVSAALGFVQFGAVTEIVGIGKPGILC